MRRRSVISVGIVLALGGSVPTASAAPERFGEPGQWAIDQSFLLAAGRSGSRFSQGLSYNNVYLAPSASWFPWRSLSLNVGVKVARGWASRDDDSLDYGSWTQLGASTGVGYVVPLGDRFSLWPSTRVSLGHAWQDPGDAMQLGGSRRSAGLSLRATCPLLWHPAEHFFVGIGPGVGWDYDGPELSALAHGSTHIELTSLVGGYFSP